MSELDELEDDLEKSGSTKIIKVLKMSEVMDAMRVIPRLVLGMYGYALYVIVKWYLDFENRFETKCDSKTLIALMDREIPLKEAQEIACTVTNVIGHPIGYTALVTVMVGMAGVIFGLYTNSGRSWHGTNSVKDQ